MPREDQSLAFAVEVELAPLGACVETYYAKLAQMNTLYKGKLSKEKSVIQSVPPEIMSMLSKELTKVELVHRLAQWEEISDCCNSRQCLYDAKHHLTEVEEYSLKHIERLEMAFGEVYLEDDFIEAVYDQRSRFNDLNKERHYRIIKEHAAYLEAFAKSLSAGSSTHGSGIRPFLHITKRYLRDSEGIRRYDDECDVEDFEDENDPIFHLDAEACILLPISDVSQVFGEEEDAKFLKVMRTHNLKPCYCPWEFASLMDKARLAKRGESLFGNSKLRNMMKPLRVFIEPEFKILGNA